MDSPHIDRIVFGRHFRRQDTADTTTKRPSLTDLLPLPPPKTTATPTTTEKTDKPPAETSKDLPSTTDKPDADGKPEETGAPETTKETTAPLPETTKGTENPPPNNGGGSAQQTTGEPNNNTGGAAQQQQQTTSTELIIESKTVTGAGPRETNSSAVSNTGASSKNAFLENKVASGIVFGICGLVGLLLILGLVWLALRKRRRIRKLEKEIISFDPEDVGGFHQKRRDGDVASVSSIEKPARSNSSLDHHSNVGYGPQATYANQDGGYGGGAPYSNFGAQVQRQQSLQRPGNAAFNPTSGPGAPPGLYQMPPQTYNHLS